MNRKSNSHKWLGVCILLKPNIKVYVNKGSHTNQYSINLISCEVKFVAYRKWTLAYKNGRCCCQQHESPWVNVFIYLSTLLNVISIYVCERVDYTRTVCCFIIYDLHLFGKCSYKIQLWIGRKEGNFSRWKFECDAEKTTHMKYPYHGCTSNTTISVNFMLFLWNVVKKVFCGGNA